MASVVRCRFICGSITLAASLAIFVGCLIGLVLIPERFYIEQNNNLRLYQDAICQILSCDQIGQSCHYTVNYSLTLRSTAFQGSGTGPMFCAQDCTSPCTYFYLGCYYNTENIGETLTLEMPKPISAPTSNTIWEILLITGASVSVITSIAVSMFINYRGPRGTEIEPILRIQS